MQAIHQLLGKEPSSLPSGAEELFQISKVQDGELFFLHLGLKQLTFWQGVLPLLRPSTCLLQDQGEPHEANPSQKPLRRQPQLFFADQLLLGSGLHLKAAFCWQHHNFP